MHILGACVTSSASEHIELV